MAINYRHVLIWIALLLCAPLNTHAQCCAAGNPSCDNKLGDAGGHYKLDVGLSYHYSYSDTYFEEHQPSDFGYMKNSYFRFIAFQLNYGLTDAWQAGLQTGYFLTKSQTFETGYFREAVGMGDLTIHTNYRLLDRAGFRLAPLLQLTLPTGDFDQKFGPVILPIDLQPSAGNRRYGGGLLASYQVSSNFGINLMSVYERSNKIKTDFTTYQYGGLSDTRLTGEYRMRNGLVVGIQAWGQIRERAIDLTGNTIHATGGELIFLCPLLTWNSGPWHVSGLLEAPVYKRTNGLQLTVKHRMSLRLSHTFDLRPGPEPNSALAVDSTVLAVRGICGMCKDRIEKTALSQQGVMHASWDKESQVLQVQISADFDLEALIVALLEAGHDTEGRTASESAYDALHSCCKYRDLRE